MKNFEIVIDVLNSLEEKGDLLSPDVSNLYSNILDKTKEIIGMNNKVTYDDLIRSLKLSSRLAVFSQMKDKELFDSVIGLLNTQIELEEGEEEETLMLFGFLVKERLVYNMSKNSADISIKAIKEAWNGIKKTE